VRIARIFFGRIRQIRCAASATTRRCGSATYDNVRTRDSLVRDFSCNFRALHGRLPTAWDGTKAGRGD